MKKTFVEIFKYAVIVLAAIISALEYMIFIDKNQFAPSGLMGVATMIQHTTGFSVAYMTAIMNIPLCIASYFAVNRHFAARTVVYTSVTSLALWLLQNGYVDVSPFVYYTEDGMSRILAPIAAGVICGLYYGVVINLDGSTGGTDIIAAIIQKLRPELNLMWIIFAINTAVAVSSYFVYGYQMESVILCVLYSFLASNVSDKMLKGGKSALKFEVITDDPERLAREIMNKLERGVTIVRAKGMYTESEHWLLICIVNRHQIAAFNEMLKQSGDSFAYISSVNEVVGQFYSRLEAGEVQDVKKPKM